MCGVRVQERRGRERRLALMTWSIGALRVARTLRRDSASKNPRNVMERRAQRTMSLGSRWVRPGGLWKCGVRDGTRRMYNLCDLRVQYVDNCSPVVQLLNIRRLVLRSCQLTRARERNNGCKVCHIYIFGMPTTLSGRKSRMARGTLKPKTTTTYLALRTTFLTISVSLFCRLDSEDMFHAGLQSC